MNRIRNRDVIAFVLMAILLVWWRSHTFAPRIVSWTGLNVWPAASATTEPLDCDEAAYGYMARRMAAGAAMYKDLTEYKPPGGYWFYAVAIAIAGASEMTVRVMILPVLVATLGLVGAIACKLSNTVGAVVAMAAFVFMSTDPYVFGNGSNLEHLMNLAGMAAVWNFLKAFEIGQDDTSKDAPGVAARCLRTRDFWLFLAGVCVGLAATVKQVALIGLVPIVFEFARSKSMMGGKFRGVGAILAGFVIPWVIAGSILAAQGALAQAKADVIDYSRALASDTPADAKAPSFATRWLTGNSDPRNGALPWPFGRTDWLVWWGGGAWPLHLLAAVVFVSSLMFGSSRMSTASRIALWQFPVAWGMIVLPGLYWQHYYLLLAPISSLLAGLLAGYAIPRLQPEAVGEMQGESIEPGQPTLSTRKSGDRNPAASAVMLIGTLVPLGFTAVIQWREYFTVPAEMLTVKYKGGAQWVSLRQLGLETKHRTQSWTPRPKVEVWGWQSPLLFYSGLDAPDRYYFTDPLAKAMIGKRHPLVGPRIKHLTESLKSARPELIFCGDVPFPELKAMLARDYIASSLVGSTPDGRGLFVRKDRYQDFHAKQVAGSGVTEETR